MNDQSNTPVPPSASEQIISLMVSLQERRRFIEDALSYTTGTHNYDDIVYSVAQGKMTWWPLPHGFMITEIYIYPREQHLHVFLAGGKLEEIYEAHPRLIEAAKLAGCSHITLGGRRGWVKALKHLGWIEYCTVAVLDVSAENYDEGRQQYAAHDFGSEAAS